MFNRLSLSNIRNKNIEFDIPKGVTCIIGRNGAGKSTVIEALCFCLFGSKKLRGSVDELLGKDGVIALSGYFPEEFTVAKRPKKAAASINGTHLLKATDIAKHFSNLFGSKDLFLNIFVAGQNAVSEISTIRSGLRRKLLVELLGLASLNAKIEEMHSDVRGLRKPVTGLEGTQEKIKTLEPEFGNLSENDVLRAKEKSDQLQKVKSLQVKPELARSKLVELQELHTTISSDFHRASMECAQKKRIIDTIGISETPECPVCYSKIDASAVRSRLEKDAKEQADKMLGAHNTLKDSERVLNAYKESSRYPTEEELAKGIPANFDPETALRGISELRSANALLNALEAEWQRYNSLKPKLELALHLKDFESAVLLKYFERLRSVVSGYLENYTPFKEFVLNEDFNFEVDGRGLHTYSGGERDLICTIFRVAISQVVSEARFGRCPIAIFDSSFDSLDERNMLAVLELLRDSPFERVIITTHNTFFQSKLDLNYIDLG